MIGPSVEPWDTVFLMGNEYVALRVNAAGC